MRQRDSEKELANEYTEKESEQARETESKRQP